MKHIGMIGFGAIAQQVYAHLAADPGYRFTLLRRAGGKQDAGVPDGVTALDRLEEFIAAAPDLVLEMAGQTAAETYLPAVLSAAIPVVICSTGALAEGEFLAQLIRAAQAAGTKLIVPPGAVGGLDYLRTIAATPGASVTYTSRKPVAAWTQELAARGMPPAAVKEPVALFEGSAQAAARLFPRNLNAALTVALAAGKASMTVRVLADPEAQGNTHEIEAVSLAGTASFRFVNAPSPVNPKTSALTALSVIAAVEDHFSDDPIR